MTIPQDSNDNPYVGPQPFSIKDQHKFFGREEEAEDLLSLVISRRSVLFYAQSGAGKSSLLNARLAPSLKERGFEVLPVGRVSGVAEVDAAVDNIFMYNLLLKLDEGDQVRPEFATMKLADFYNFLVYVEGKFHFDDQYQYPADYVPAPRVLIIDQFEEILTSYPEEKWETRVEFFKQLGRLMELDPQLWVVLSLREDYVAGLDPFAHLLPDGLRNRYYMQRMRQEAALDAIIKPVTTPAWQWEFDKIAAEELVRNLRQIQAGQLRQSDHEVLLGDFVEPVQLQVVCYQLWRNLDKTKPDKRITLKDLEALAKSNVVAEFVNDALAQFYNDAIAAVAEDAPNRTEFDLRQWFETELITQSRTRNLIPVDWTNKKTGSLDNDLVEKLDHQFRLVRPETRAGENQWYELVHDRLIDPVLQANTRWQQQHPLIEAARAWQDTKDDKKLYQGRRLAEAWQEPDAKLPLVKRFLEASEAAETQRQKDRKMAEAIRINRLLWLATIVIAIALGIAGYFWWQVSIQKGIADKQTAIAKDQTRQLQEQTERLQEQAELLDRANKRANNETNKARLAKVEADRQTIVANAALIALEASNMFEDGRYETGLLLSLAALDILTDSVKARDVFFKGLQQGWPPLEHKATVRAAAFSPDGKTVLSADNNGTLTIWDVSDRRSLQQFEQGFEYVTSMTLDPRGQWAAIAGCANTNEFDECRENKIVLLDVVQNSAPQSITTTTQINSVAFSPNGTQLAGGGSDGMIRLWDAVTGREIQQLTGHTDRINAITFSPDGAMIASGSADSTVRLWDATTGQEIRPLTGHTGWVNSVAFNSAGNQIVSGDDLTVRLWEVATGQEIPQLTGHTNWVNAVVFSPNGSQILSGSADSTVRLWDVATGREIQQMTGHTGGVYSVAFSPDGTKIVSGGEDRTVRIWTPDQQDSLGQRLVSPVNEVSSVAFHPYKPLLAAGSCNQDCSQGEIRWWDEAGQPLETWPINLSGQVTSLAFAPDGQWLAVSAVNDPDILLYQVKTTPALAQTEKITFTQTITLPRHRQGITRVAFSPDGKMLVSAGQDNQLLIWSDWSSQDVITPTTLAAPFVPGDFALFVPTLDDSIIAAVGGDHLTIWRGLASQQSTISETVRSQGGALLKSVSFSPNGQIIFTGTDQGNIIAWDVDPLRPIGQPYPGHTGPLRRLTFSPDKISLISVGEDSRLILWQLNGDKLRRVGNAFTGHTSGVSDAVFNAAGTKLASAGQEVILWSTNRFEWGELACKLAGRNLTNEEWTNSALYEVDPHYPETCLDFGVHPSVVEAKLVEAEKLARNGQVTEALRLFEESGQAPAELQPRVIQALIDQGQQFLLDDNSDTKANDYFHNAFRLNQSLKADLQTMLTIGHLIDTGRELVGQKKYDEALDTLDQAVALDPEFELMNQKRLLAALYEDLCGSLNEACPQRENLARNEIQPGEVVTDTITSGVIQAWTFIGEKNQVVTISMDKTRTDSTLDPYLTLKNLDEEALTSNGDFEGYNARIDSFLIPAGGIYQIEAGAYSGAGEYVLTVVEARVERLTFGEQKQADLQDNIRWTFDGQPGDIVSVIMKSNGGNISPRLTLLDAAGTNLTDSYGYGNNSSSKEARINRYKLSGEESYTILPQADSTAGSYTLTLVKQTDAGEIQLGGTEMGALEANDIAAWRFQAERGDIVKADLVAQNDTFQPRLTLLDESGNTLLADDGVDGKVGFNYYVPESGSATYTLLVEETQGSAGGYTLSLQPGQPNSINIGDHVTATPEDGQLWTFEGEAGQEIGVTLSPTNEGNASLTLQDQTGQELAFNTYDNPNPLGPGVAINRLTLSETAPYTLTVFTDPPDTYELRLTNLQPEQILFDDPVLAELEANKVWTFEGQPGEVVNIDLVGSQKIELAVLGPDNVLVASTAADSSQASTGASSLKYTILRAEGSYTIAPLATEESGIYKLSLKKAPVETLVYGEPLTGSLESGAIWQFEGEAGQVIKIETEEITPGIAPSFELRGASGEYITASSGSSLTYYTLPYSDTYLIFPNEPSENGVYSLELTQYPIQLIEYGATITGNLAAETLWQFEAKAGDIVSIAMDDAGSGINPSLSLWQAANYVTSDDDSGGDNNALIRRFQVATDGLYTIFPQEYSGAATGVYTLSLGVETSAGTIEAGTSQDSRIEPNGSYAWTFDGQTGDVVEIELTADRDGLAPKLTLLDSFGGLIAEAEPEDNQPKAALETLLTQTGPYTILVEGAKGQGGGYALSVQPKTVPQIHITESKRGNVAETSIWTLPGQAGQMVDIEIQADTADTDTSLKLYDPDGNYTDTYGVDRAKIRKNLASDAEYTIVVNVTGEQQGYTLAIRKVNTENLVMSETKSANIADSILFTFEAEVGDLVTIAMTATHGSDLDTQLRLIGPNGEEAAYNDDSPAEGTDSLIRDHLITVDGRYVIVPDTYSGSGTYDLTLSEGQLTSNDATAYANRAHLYAQQADYQAAQADYEKMKADFDKAIELDPDNHSYYNALCWFSSLLGHAEEVVDTACQESINLATQDEAGQDRIAGYRDSRGVARALTGDFSQAIEDFEFYIEYGGYYSTDRREWIDPLKNGENPLTEEELLDRLRNE